MRLRLFCEGFRSKFGCQAVFSNKIEDTKQSVNYAYAKKFTFTTVGSR